MKFFPAEFLFFFRSRASKKNLARLVRFMLVLSVIVTAYSVLFHFLMAREGQAYSWVTGFYWTLTVMSTLGFGDITFHTDLGRLFSILVLLSGMIFLLVLLPFTFIEFFYEPWTEAQEAARAPRQLPEETTGHVVLVEYDAMTQALIDRLEHYRYQYVLVEPELESALRLHDQGVNVMVGALDDPETYQHARVQNAALVATSRSDAGNTTVTFQVRSLSDRVPIIATCVDRASVEILKLAGATHVVRVTDVMGQWLARRTVGGDALTHVIGEFGPLLVAEATAARTPLAGKTLREHGLRQKVGVSVVGIWERGHFEPAEGNTRIHENTILVLAGSREQLDLYDELFCIYNVSGAPVVIIGGGRVGRATGRALKEREVDFRIIEREASRVWDEERTVVGNAAEPEILETAGLMDAPAVVITTHDDDLNIYMTIFCRRLRPDIQILTRATHERSVETLHRAGADVVISHAATGANMIINLLKRSDIVMVDHGLDLFKVKVPEALVGRSIAEAEVRDRTGCSLVAISANGDMTINPDPTQPLPAEAEVIFIGSVEAEDRFLDEYGQG